MKTKPRTLRLFSLVLGMLCPRPCQKYKRGWAGQRGGAGIRRGESPSARLAGTRPGWDPSTDARPTVWEATHHLIERLNTHGEVGAARLLAKMPPDLAADARQLAYRLYSLCERKSWAEHARDYNALVISWNASQEQARVVKDQVRQGKLL